MKDRYSGVCYDGPKEGELIAHPWPEFQVALCRGLLSIPKDWTLPVPPDFVQLAYYRWSNPLRKWVFVPPDSLDRPVEM